MSKHIWIVEYHWTEGWEQTPEDDDGSFLTYRTKREANSDLITGKYSGHPSDLRIRKYVREEK